jgi:heme/copper-type cytochrome/quinol oxidase subunit 2
VEWYWWVAIAVGVVVLGYFKLKVWGKLLEAQKAKKAAQEALEDE